MKKTSLLSLLLLSVSCIVTSCDKNISSNTGSTNQDSTNQSSDVAKKVSFIDDVVCPAEDQISEMSLSGVFLDIEVGSHLVVGKDYSFTLSNLPDDFKGTPVFEISDTSVFTIETVSNTSYVLKTHKEGGAILVIMDQDGIMYYRNAVNLRNKVDKEDLLNYFVSDVNYFISTFYNTQRDNYKLMFETTDGVVFEATEGGVYYGYMDLEFTYTGEKNTSDYYEYVYELVVTDKEDYNTLSPTWMNISVVGDMIHFGDDANGIYDFFKPVINE